MRWLKRLIPVLMLHSCKKSFSRKIPVLPIEKFLPLGLFRNARMLQHLIIQLSFHYLSTSRSREVKNKRKFQIFSSKSCHGCHIGYERWSLTGGSKYSDLTWKLLIFWKLVAEETGGRNGRFHCICRLVAWLLFLSFCCSRHWPFTGLASCWKTSEKASSTRATFTWRSKV